MVAPPNVNVGYHLQEFRTMPLVAPDPPACRIGMPPLSDDTA
ncbi:hypothetical protein [Streptomyces sp. NPDC046862]